MYIVTEIKFRDKIYMLLITKSFTRNPLAHSLDCYISGQVGQTGVAGPRGPTGSEAGLAILLFLRNE